MRKYELFKALNLPDFLFLILVIKKVSKTFVFDTKNIGVFGSLL